MLSKTTSGSHWEQVDGPMRIVENADSGFWTVYFNFGDVHSNWWPTVARAKAKAAEIYKSYMYVHRNKDIKRVRWVEVPDSIG